MLLHEKTDQIAYEPPFRDELLAITCVRDFPLRSLDQSSNKYSSKFCPAKHVPLCFFLNPVNSVSIHVGRGRRHFRVLNGYALKPKEMTSLEDENAQ